MATIERIYVKIGEHARALRIKEGLSQAAVAEACGLSRSVIANIETGRSRIMLHDLVSLMKALGQEPPNFV